MIDTRDNTKRQLNEVKEYPTLSGGCCFCVKTQHCRYRDKSLAEMLKDIIMSDLTQKEVTWEEVFAMDERWNGKNA